MPEGPVALAVTGMLLVFGLAFEVPLVVVILNLAGVLSHARFRKWRRMMIFAVFAFAAVAVARREVGAGEEGLLGRGEEHRHRPAAAAGEHLHGIHVNVVDIRTFFPVNLDLSSLVGQSVNFILYVADVSGHGTPTGDRAAWVGARITGAGGTAVACTSDVSSKHGARAPIEAALDQFGELLLGALEREPDGPRLKIRNGVHPAADLEQQMIFPLYLFRYMRKRQAKLANEIHRHCVFG